MLVNPENPPSVKTTYAIERAVATGQAVRLD
jgi:hypothetical protein